MRMTYELAFAISTDAANRNMREHGRTTWNEDDRNLAAKKFNELWPII